MNSLFEKRLWRGNYYQLNPDFFKLSSEVNTESILELADEKIYLIK